MQVAVLKLGLCCEKTKKKAMSTVCGLSGVNAVDVKDGKLTVTGEIDAYIVVKKLKKVCFTEIISVGPVKEPEKKPPEPKKPDEPKPPEVICHYVPSPCPPPYYPYYRCGNDDPNACVTS
ncbi:heavy metal-associated isoprenylated plant protein 12 [Capsella rubella]|uniref:heavy metal-associated isoprenylated plant protein 12 n=1 Tax=Capsella rubella TaxID=81985 RepID=UPI000CD4C04F|nr:heavy metal-associated isoprenylated plant protein 12 [Capsella rubella]